jgi:hypothetical protein
MAISEAKAYAALIIQVVLEMRLPLASVVETTQMCILAAIQVYPN